MAKKNVSATKTAAKLVMDVFLRRNAVSEESAIKVDEFKNLRLTTSVISYTLANFINDGIVRTTEDNRYYFVEEEWNKMKKTVGKAYWILFGLPLIVLIIILLVTNWNDLSAIFIKK